jgi:hypothetical protein
MPTEIRPVLNPVLSFKRDPRLVVVTGRSAQESQVVAPRLDEQKTKLSSQLLSLEKLSTRQHAGKLLVAIKMFDDSLAPTYEPESIFREPLGSELIAPIEGGYLAQVDQRALRNLSNIVRDCATTDVRVTVSRIKDISAQTEADVLRGRTAQSLWEHATHEERGRIFTLWLAPYQENLARLEVASQISEFAEAKDIYSLADLVSITREQGSDGDQLKTKSVIPQEASFGQSGNTDKILSHGCNLLLESHQP